MSEYNHIDYTKHPRFNVGTPNQWGEYGYLLYEGAVYFFEDDRHDCHYRVDTPRTPQEFIDYAKKKRITIPQDFKKLLKELIEA